MSIKLHFTAKHISAEHHGYITEWARLNPDLKVQMYSDDDNLKLIQDYYPEFLEQYKGFKYNIERVDFVRYAYLHNMGGVYSDIDIQPIRSISPLLTGEIVLPIEPIPNGLGNRFLVANYFMIAPKGSEMMYAAMVQAAKPFVYTGDKRIDVLKRTGCIMLTELIKNYYCALLSAEYFTPTDPNDKQAYGIHHYSSTWW